MCGHTRNLLAKYMNDSGYVTAAGIGGSVFGLKIGRSSSAGSVILRDGGVTGTILYQSETFANSSPEIINFPANSCIRFNSDIYFVKDQVNITILYLSMGG